jgi:hypothetical protein
MHLGLSSLIAYNQRLCLISTPQANTCSAIEYGRGPLLPPTFREGIAREGEHTHTVNVELIQNVRERLPESSRETVSPLTG